MGVGVGMGPGMGVGPDLAWVLDDEWPPGLDSSMWL